MRSQDKAIAPKATDDTSTEILPFESDTHKALAYDSELKVEGQLVAHYFEYKGAPSVWEVGYLSKLNWKGRDWAKYKEPGMRKEAEYCHNFNPEQYGKYWTFVEEVWKGYLDNSITDDSIRVSEITV